MWEFLRIMFSPNPYISYFYVLEIGMVFHMKKKIRIIILLYILVFTTKVAVPNQYLKAACKGNMHVLRKQNSIEVMSLPSNEEPQLREKVAPFSTPYSMYKSVKTPNDIKNFRDARPKIVWNVASRVGSLSGSPPPSNGDWVIDDTTIVKDSVLIINGSIIINETGALILINTSIYMNLSYDGEHNIEVYGNLTVLNSSITAYYTDNNYRIISYEGSKLRIESSEISYAGYISYSEYAGVRIETNNAVIKNSLIRYSCYGVYLYSSNYSVISGNTIVNNSCAGIYIGKSFHNTIFNNRVTHTEGGLYCQGCGIYCIHSEHNNISQNTIESNGKWGFYLIWSYYNQILDNVFIKDGMYVKTALYNTVENNTVNGKPLIYLEDKDNLVIDNQAGEIILINCRDIKIRNQNITNTDAAILVWDSSGTITNSTIKNNYLRGIIVEAYYYNCTIYGNTIENNNGGIYVSSGWVNISNNKIINDCIYMFSGGHIANNTIIIGNPYGIYLSSVTNTVVQGNTIRNSTIGIYIRDSDKVDILENILENNTKGVYLEYSVNITLSRNTLENNEQVGVELYNSNNTAVSENTINGSMIGIRLENSNKNNITGNTVMKSSDFGILLNNSSNNTVYLNNFIDNTNQYNVSDGSGNRFYSPNPITYTFSGRQYTNYTGNNWSDYTGNDTNFDGIGDEPYGMDAYPLIGVARIVDGHVEILTDAPQVTIISPENNTAINETTVVVRWNGSDPTYDLDHYEVYVNGTPMNTSIPPSVAECTLTLDEGCYIITVRAVDQEGNIGIDKIYIEVDTTSPSLEILSPKNNSNLNSSPITILWESSDDLAGVDHYELYSNGEPVDTNIPPTQTEYSIALSDGSYIIILVAVDRAGNIAKQTIKITVDATPPTIEILSPNTNSFFNTTRIVIHWSADDSFSGVDHYELYVDDNPLDVNISPTVTNYTISLDEGNHIITVKAIDAFGNVGEDYVHLIIDTTPPMVEITSPMNGSISNSTIVEIYWNGQDYLSGIDHYELYVNGELINRYIPHTFISYSLILDEGENLVTIRAVDKAGNVGESTLKMVVDTTPPRVEFTAPRNTTVLNITTIMVSWRGEDSLSGIDHYEIYVDGEPINMSIPPDQKQYEIHLGEGTYTIAIKAVDKAKNVGRSTLRIIIDTTPPLVKIISPENNTMLNTTTITLQWEAYDNISGIEHFEVYVNGEPINVTIPPTQTRYTIILREGKNVIIVVAIDRAGNAGVSTLIVNVRTLRSYLIYLIVLLVPTVTLIVLFWKRRKFQKYREVNRR